MLAMCSSTRRLYINVATFVTTSLYVSGMDDENLLAIRTAAEYWRSFSPDIPPDYSMKASGFHPTHKHPPAAFLAMKA